MSVDPLVEPLVGYRARTRASTLCLAVAKYRDVRVSRPAYKVAEALVERHPHVLELYGGQRLSCRHEVGARSVAPGCAGGHRYLRIRVRPGTPGAWVEALARYVDGGIR